MVQIVSASLGLKALREAGYRTTASAIAELVDNSIEANAKNVDIVAISRPVQVQSRTSLQIEELAVLDDGHGMPPETLAHCLSLGWGTHLDKHEKLGKFGFGLKGSSIAQARRVDVYSWIEPGEVYRAFLDLDDVEEHDQSELPPVERVPLPKLISQHLETRSSLQSSNSGTVVVWTKIDKIDVKRTPTLLKRLDKDLCRIHRHFLDDNDELGERVSINLFGLLVDGSLDGEKTSLRANDPLYLLTPNNLPDHENFATNVTVDTFELAFGSGRPEEIVEVICTVASPEVQLLGGNSAVGKHYSGNTGISVVRAGREIELSSFGFLDRSEPRHRWWGIEIRFHPHLDSLFGITNNKQEARGLRSFDDGDLEALSELSELSDDNTSAVVDFKLTLDRRIKDLIKSCMVMIKGRKEGSLKAKKEKKFVEIINIDVSKDSSETSSSKEADTISEPDKLDARVDLLLADDTSLSKLEARDIASATLPYRIDIRTDSWPGDLFLDVTNVANAAVAKINRDHPFYDKLWNFLEQEADQKGFEALEVMLMAYCRAEDELSTRFERQVFEQLRNRWGSWVKELIRHAGS
jgi:hypothetical protein